MIKNAGTPTPIGAEQLKRQQKPVEEVLENYGRYGKEVLALHTLLSNLDKEEPYIMSDIERDSYLAIRTGMQVFLEVSDMVGKKIGVEAARRTGRAPKVETGVLVQNPEVPRLLSFANGYAAFLASTYISNKLSAIIAKASEGKALPEQHIDLEGRVLNFSEPTTTVMQGVLFPIYKILSDNVKIPESAFKYPAEFPQVAKSIFDQTASSAKALCEQQSGLLPNVMGYRWLVLDGELDMLGFEDRTLKKAAVTQSLTSFQPITANEIVGNQLAKQKIQRYVDRLMLYNLEKELNPLLELGGLAWTVLFDGPPGTGKSSLFRLAMTRMKHRAEQMGRNTQIFMVDQSIKDEFYGKTGKILLERLAVTNDPKIISIGILDDLDLLTTSRDDAQGADNDINNILMQYLDGAQTVRRGQVINFTASNKPTGLDNAMRNRMNDRTLIEGPVTAEDFADMAKMRFQKLVKNGLLSMPDGYTPFATQNQVGADGKWTGGKIADAIADLFGKRYKNATFFDFGHYMARLKKKNPLVTGRSANAIFEAVKDRSADFDIPEEWFANPAIFQQQTWDKQLGMLKELYVKIEPSDLFEEAKRYFDSEERYRANDAAEAVTRGYNNLLWDHQSQIRFLEDQAASGNAGLPEMSQLGELRSLVSQRLEQAGELRERVRKKIEENLATREKELTAATEDEV